MLPVCLGHEAGQLCPRGWWSPRSQAVQALWSCRGPGEAWPSSTILQLPKTAPRARLNVGFTFTSLYLISAEFVVEKCSSLGGKGGERLSDPE